MEALRRTYEQFLSLFRQMSASQRGTLIAVPLMVIAAFGMLLYQRTGGDDVALSWGKVFNTEDLIHAETALLDAGLKDFYREGRRIMVPADEVERYNAALVEFNAMPTDWASEWETQYEKAMGPFTPAKQLQEMKEIALAKQLRRIIRAVPEVEDAGVVWARSPKRTWGRPPKVTATVSIRLRQGRELSQQLVRSLQTAVANMVPDLSAEDVTVFDQASGRSHSAEDADDPLENRLVHRIEEFEGKYRGVIEASLQYIPDIVVAVHVDLENLKSSVIRKQTVDPKNVAAVYQTEETRSDTLRRQPSQREPGQVSNRPREVTPQFRGTDTSREVSDQATQVVNGVSFEVTEQELLAAMPKAVQVSVQVPKDYYQAIAAKRGVDTTDEAVLKKELDTIEQEVTTNIQQTVAQLIPAGSPAEAVSVQSIDRLDQTIPEITTPLTVTLMEWISQWGGTLGLAMFAGWVLWMLNRSMPKSAADTPEDDSEAKFDLAVDPEPGDGATHHEPTRRDQLQDVVRENPEMAAAVISKWIQAAK